MVFQDAKMVMNMKQTKSQCNMSSFYLICGSYTKKELDKIFNKLKK